MMAGLVEKSYSWKLPKPLLNVAHVFAKAWVPVSLGIIIFWVLAITGLLGWKIAVIALDVFWWMITALGQFMPK